MSVQGQFADALRHHQEGNLAEAEPLYRMVLDAEPAHADALHLLGVLKHQIGESQEAVELIEKALAIDDTPADFHGNLGLALQALGRVEDAVAAQERAIARNPDHAGAHFNLALALVADGKRERAAVHYAEAARLSPSLADAHLNLGAILQDLGRADEALVAHERAAALLPGDPRPWMNRAISLRQLGRLDEAAAAARQAAAFGGREDGDAAALAMLAANLHAQGRLHEAAAHYGESLRIDQGNPIVLNNFGILLQELNEPDRAAVCFEAAFALKPDFAEPRDNLGTLRAKQGRLAEAEALHCAALRHKPDLAGAWNNLGNARKALGRRPAAFPAWRAAIALEPGRAEFQSNLGNGLREDERFAEADLCHRRAVRLAPGEAVPNNNHGHALQGRLLFAEAAGWFRRALALDPAYAEAWSNLGLARQRLGDALAERCYDRSLRLRPDLPLAHFNKGLLRLEAGDLTAGWPGYAWRFAAGQVGAGRQPRAPAWRGEDLAGRRLLVWGEQGVGDSILFSALVPEIAVRTRSAILEVDHRLVPLFARSFPGLTVRAEAIDAQGRETMAVPDYDRHVPMGSLPRVLRGKLSSFPAGASWLVPDPARVAGWRDRLAGLGSGLMVGIGWRSQLLTMERSAAYVGLEWWGALFAVPGVTWVVLQYGDCEAEIAEAERRFGIRLHRWDDLDRKDDFDGVAALIAALDLVISPAMSVGELAGALGTPVWRFGHRDWTQLGSGVRPWFPSMRLFQPRSGEALAGTLVRMAAHLRDLAPPTRDAPPPPALPPDPQVPAVGLGDGLRLHQAGRLDEAEAVYRAILAADAEHPDALHLLGVAAHQRNRNEEATALIARAIARRGDVAEYHGNLGSVLQALGRLPQAVGCYETALRLRPAYPDALNNLGSALQALGRLPEAEARYRAALAQRPGFVQALANLGTALHAMGRRTEALACLADAVERDPAALDARLGLGALLNDLGRAAEAEIQYRAALALDDADSDAHAGLGAALFKRGRHAEAAGSLERAVGLGNRRGVTLDLLGAAHRLLGDPAAAERWHRAAVAAEPLRAAARTNLALAVGAQGRLGEAAVGHRQALAVSPAFPEVLNNLGVALQGLGAGEPAVACHRRAVRLAPASAESWGNLAAALLTLKRHGEALVSAVRAVALAPALTGALTTGGAARKGMERFADAARDHRRALRVTPGHAKAWSNLGTALAGLSRWEEALTAHRRALALAPALADAHLNLGHAEQVLGRSGAARRHAERTIRLAPGRADARMNRALLRLSAGDLDGGWRDYAARFPAGESRGRRFAMPEWLGEDPSGLSILVWGEQGLGDEIMFGTALPDLVRRAGRLVVECDARLVRLFARALPGAEVRAPTGDPRDCDRHAAMGSVAAILRRRLGDFPTHPGFLVPDPLEAARWRDRLAALGSGLTVGVCWRSSRITAERAGAYSRLDQWGPLFAVPGLRFVNLQYDECAAELADARRRFGVAIATWPDLDLRNDLDAVAALMAGLDLVITAPTSVGELAAAVGIPVWRLGGGNDWSALGAGVRPWFPAMAVLGRDGRGHADTIAGAARRLRGMGVSPAPKSGEGQKLIVG
ncbi:tetratricopeptide repeat protein [Azospirillum agricola]|uniref:tetratricopeptide repeat protein n=1 Tax=Azospirillum agricola TaxID=1720247 RepID=UPI002D7E9992|nr:tetratricopeptide repeat protein [Azospirillum agricola]